MNEKVLSCDCSNCESSFGVQYYTEYVSLDEPQFCPFCGETIDDIQEEYIEEEENFEDDEWNNDY
jgi:hypothetical protein